MSAPEGRAAAVAKRRESERARSVRDLRKELFAVANHVAAFGRRNHREDMRLLAWLLRTIAYGMRKVPLRADVVTTFGPLHDVIDVVRRTLDTTWRSVQYEQGDAAIVKVSADGLKRLAEIVSYAPSKSAFVPRNERINAQGGEA